ncbi:MAG: alginate lyase family protein [Devosia sp.]
MFRRLMTAVVLASAFVTPAFAYEEATVRTAQEALIRLGYDPGPVDGQWGGKTRAALNEVRANEGLPPAQDFSGSSLWLIHKLSPGPTTLPHPGQLLTDLVERRKFLQVRSSVATRLCDVGAWMRPDEEPVRETIRPINTANGYITANDDWYSGIWEGLVESQAMCIINKKNYCDVPIALATNWADADAIKPGARPGQNGAQDVYWIGNATMSSVIFAYATAATFKEVDPVTHAEILDWMKRRVDDYHSSKFGANTPVGSIDNGQTSNHALARMMPAFLFGALVGDRSMMQPALDSWNLVLTSMREDGSLPTETRRGARWFQYSTVHIGQLLAVAQVAKMQGIDLVPPNDTQTIPQALSFLVAAIQDFDLAVPYSKANQGSPSNDYTIPFIRNFQMGILPAYRALYGEDENILALRDATVDERLCSPAAMKENKGNLCEKMGQPPYSFSRMLGQMEQQPHHHMGYPAGCMFQQSLSPVGPDGL